MNHDSAVVVRGDGQTVLDLNDARLFPIQFRAIRQAVGGTIDVFAFQGAGASWYPMCYDFPEERRRELSRAEARSRSSRTSARRDAPPRARRSALPFAGPPCFLAPDLFRAQRRDGGRHLPGPAAGGGLARRPRASRDTTLLLPGDAWDIATRTRERRPALATASTSPTAGRTSTPTPARRQRHSRRVWPAIPNPDAVAVGAVSATTSSASSRMSPYFNRHDRHAGRASTSTGPGGGAWTVDFRPGAEGVARRAGRRAPTSIASLRDGCRPLLDGEHPVGGLLPLAPLRGAARSGPLQRPSPRPAQVRRAPRRSRRSRPSRRRSR